MGIYVLLINSTLVVHPEKKALPLDILKFLVTTLSNQDKKYALTGVGKYGALARSFEFMSKCHNMNIIVQTIVGYASSLNGQIEIPNNTLDDIKRSILLNISHNK